SFDGTVRAPRRHAGWLSLRDDVAVSRRGSACACARRESWRNPARPVGRSRAMRRPLLERLQRHFDRLLELRIGAARVILWRVIDLDVGVGTVVLDAPTDVVEEERELGLGG